MFKKTKVLALLLCAAGAALVPHAAFAQDGYYAPRDNYYYQSDRRADRHEAREWREQERRDRRAEEWRERAIRRDERRYRDDRWRDPYRGDYRSNAYFGFDYRR